MILSLDKLPNKLTKVGRMTSTELKSLQIAFAKLKVSTEVDDGFRVEHIAEHDHLFARRHGFYRAFKQALEHHDYAMFETLHQTQERALDAVFKRVTGGVDYKGVKPPYDRKRLGDSFAFSGYYAMQHNDKHIDTDGQLCFIVHNPDRHILWSQNKGRRAVELVPKAGDIVYLNTHEEHALMIGKGRKPLQFYSMQFHT